MLANSVGGVTGMMASLERPHMDSPCALGLGSFVTTDAFLFWAQWGEGCGCRPALENVFGEVASSRGVCLIKLSGLTCGNVFFFFHPRNEAKFSLSCLK